MPSSNPGGSGAAADPAEQDPKGGTARGANGAGRRPAGTSLAAFPARTLVLLGTLLALAAAPAAGQTTVVSNTGQTNGQTLALTGDLAQPFTTQHYRLGYTLTEVGIQLAGIGSPNVVNTVEIYTESSNAPGTSLGTLSGPATFTANAVASYTTTGIALSPGTNYFVVVNGASGADSNYVQTTESTDEDGGNQASWLIGNVGYHRSTMGAWLIRPVTSRRVMEIAIKAAQATNSAPVFDPSAVTRSIPENSPVGTAVGDPVTATDANGDTLTYVMTGADPLGLDSVAFDLDAATGQIRTNFFCSCNHEGKASYSLIFTASDGEATATATVTITITDVEVEPPPVPATPVVNAVPGSSTSLTVSWTAPDDPFNRPAITSYDVQYRAGTDGTWTDGPQDVDGTSATLTGLLADTLYQVQVRATNDDGDSGWSDPPGSGRTNTATAYLVSNTGQADGTPSGLSSDFAQAFTTGGNSTGYVLTGVDVKFAAVGATAAIPSMSIFTESGSLPGSSVGALTAPSSLTANAANSYTTTGIDLSASTTYFVVVDGTAFSTANLQKTASDDEDAGGSPGWSIANIGRWKSLSATTWSGTLDESLMIAVRGSANAGGSNNAPAFSPSAVTRAVAENTAAGQDVGTPVAATDTDGDTLTYSLAGTDAASFDIVPASGQIRTKAGVSYDHEAKASYSVTVRASDGTATADATVTITVTDVNEPPAAPATPTVNAVPGSSTSLTVSWAAPANDGKPPITGYDVQYRAGTSGTWTDGPEDVNDTSATVSGLLADTLYQVRVRATNDEGDSGWSDPPGSGRTNRESDAAVKNLDQTSDVGQGLGALALATAFTTGSGQASWPLACVTVAINSWSQGSVTVRIHDASGENPGSQVATLASPSRAPGLRTFCAPDGTSLAGGTTYFVVVEGSSSTTIVSLTQSDNEDSGAYPGWSIANSGRLRNVSWDSQGPNSLRMAILTYRASGTPLSNNAPAFSASVVTRSVAENTAAGQPVGTPVTATDTDGDTLTYSLAGTDAASFDIVPASGQIRTKAGVSYDHEAKALYSVTVRASDGTATAGATVTITVTDVNEPPAAPATPGLSGVSGSSTSLSVSWAAPPNAGKPPITGYDVRYREGTSGGWTLGPQNVPSTSAMIENLDADTPYQAQVRASNDEGDSGWSEPPGSGRTNVPGNRAPAFPGSSATRDLPENSPGGTDVGDPVTATDPDAADTLDYSLAGADAGLFSIDGSSGQIRAGFGETFDHEARSRYAVVVRADDGRGGADTIAVTIRITDEREPPDAPSAVAVSPVPGSGTSLVVTWDIPATSGRPAVASYDLQYRQSGETDWRNGPQNQPSARSEITGLEAGVDYDVQVRATNAEGDSEWSAPGSGRTHALAARVVQAPGRHDGSTPFAVRIQFSEEIAITDEAEFRDDAVRVVAGSATAARRLSGNLWEVTLEPDSDEAIVISLLRGVGCSAQGALCTAGGAPLSHDLEHAVPGPDTAVLTIRAVSPTVTEGSPAVFELQRSGPAPDGPLTVSLTVLREGDVFPGSPPQSTDFGAGESTVRLEVATDDDSVTERGGYILYRLEADPASPPGYVPGARTEAAVRVLDNDGGQAPPVPPLARASSARSATSSGDQMGNPQPLQLALWTDRPGYVAGQSVRLYRTLHPHGESGRYRTFVYLEKAGGGERRYLAPIDGEGTLRAEAVDHRGIPAWAATARTLFPADKALVWEGPAPEVGLWRFVMDLRPEGAAGPEDEIDGRLGVNRGIRRAWANFAVARHSQLLNRRGFDREVRSDMTLTPDYLYFLGHQLFVRDGATLTIEPGTVLRAWGRHAAIIVEQGGKIVAEGTPAAPVVLTCSLPAGQREPGCWGGLRLLGKAPVTRLEGVAGGVLPPERGVYGGSDPQDSSGTLRYVRVEFAGAGAEPGASAPAIGLYSAGDGTAIEYVQAHASLGPGVAFSGGTAACDHCVASGSGAAGLAWERGWRGSASHLYVQHSEGGTDGIDGAGDQQGWDLEPRSLPNLANLTLVHSHPYGRRERRGAGLRLSAGSGVRARDLLATSFGGGAIDARARSALLFRDGQSSVTAALLYLNGVRQLRGVYETVEFIHRNPRLRDVRWFANPDPRPRLASPALRPAEAETGEEGPAEPHYIGAFGEDTNWLEEWTFFGSESDYDTTGEDEGDN